MAHRAEVVLEKDIPKKWNRHQIQLMLPDHLENLRDWPNVRKHRVTKSPVVQLMNSYGEWWQARSGCELSMDETRALPNGQLFFRIYDVGKLSNKEPIAYRSYTFSLSEQKVLNVSSFVTVTEEYKRLGLGSSLLSLDNQIHDFLIAQCSPLYPLKRLKAEIIDGTSVFGDESRWTTRRCQEQKQDGWRVQDREGSVFYRVVDLTLRASLQTKINELVHRMLRV